MRSGKSVEQPSIVHPAWVLACAVMAWHRSELALTAGESLHSPHPSSLHAAEVPWKTVDVTRHTGAQLSRWLCICISISEVHSGSVGATQTPAACYCLNAAHRWTFRLGRFLGPREQANAAMSYAA
ncbi:hypothetical protein CKAH01_08135 [Colletotrichum kahawae]|uniref:Uncharacterized protein n=1 Tax=Colletotrichum kahawae TaxID=34407 RepID=A0AAD9Y3J6_COLKA|nr:hypothetical protein CKAH01_08135 [Colletotrichum kahawae]